jgi:hypothetical protein
LNNTAEWIFTVSKMQEKSIKNQMRGGNKSYNNLVEGYLRFLLVVVVLKLNQILNLLVTIDATL